MSAKYLVPALLVSLLAGCASTEVASTPSEADYVTPNWINVANPAGTLMTDASTGSASDQAGARGGSTAH